MRAPSHVRKEIDIVVPARINGNASASVVFIVLVFRIMASVAKSVPNSPFGRFFILTMSGVSLTYSFLREASARLAIPVFQTAGINQTFVSTIAKAKKTSARVHCSERDNSPTTEPLTCQIGEWIGIT